MCVKRLLVNALTVVKTMPSQLGLFLVPLALFCALFLPAFHANTRFSYRDVAFYYYPLFEQIQKSWENHVVPLWNPYDNLGQPLLADPTASVFYPFKLLFFLSSYHCLSYSFCFKVYIWLHIGIAYLTSYRLSRRIRISRLGAHLSALSYTFSGQTLFQYSNVVYLVGAAWSPAILLWGLDLATSDSLKALFKRGLKLSTLLALVIFGGEAQIAYLTLLVITALLFSQQLRKRVARVSPSDGAVATTSRTNFLRALALSLTVSLCVGTLALTLAAIQVLPSLELANRSMRATSSGPHSIWNLSVGFLKDPELARSNLRASVLCDDFQTDGVSRNIYKFSVGPWRWLEFIMPNPGGRQFPQATRWFSALPEELAVWTPSLYFGAFPAILAFSALRLCRRRRVGARENELTQNARAFASWLVLLGLLGALGGYGAVWFGRVIHSLFASTPLATGFKNGDPVGGVYWLCNILIPGFVQFRYPAKFMTLAMLGFSILIGLGWDYERTKRPFRIYWRFAFAFCALGAVVLTFTDPFGRLKTFVDPLFGPFLPELARKVVLISCLHAALALLCARVMLLMAQRKRCASHVCATVALLTVAADLYFAQSWLIVVTPEAYFRTPSYLSRQPRGESPAPMRIYRYPVWFTPLFQTESTVNRNDERVMWDVLTSFPKYPMTENVATIDSRGAFMEKNYEAFINRLGEQIGVERQLAFLDVDYVVGPEFWVKRILPQPDEKLPTTPTQNDWNYDVRATSEPRTRATLIREATNEETLTSGAQDVLPTHDSIAIVEYTPNRITYLVAATQNERAIFAEQFWPDWFLTLYPIDTNDAVELYQGRMDAVATKKRVSKLRNKSSIVQRAPIRPYEKFLRQADIPQGTYCATVEYRPLPVRIGAWLTVLAWTFLLTCVYYLQRKRPA
ncbi:MAG: hypothetical protein Q4G03_03375 [Planctomycetia bacterium]|nr:hypothetical protein [Planctomycetia bacterium]